MDTNVAGSPSGNRLLDRCPQCGYLLTGLPDEGVCPECGERYDPSIVMLWGWARGARAAGENTRYMLGGWLKAYAGALLVTFVLLRALAGGIGLAGYVPGWVLAVVAVAAVVALSLRRRRQMLADAPAPVQLRITPSGFAQRDGVGPVQLQPWARRKRLYVGYRRSGYCRIRSYRRYLWRTGPEVVDFDWPCSADAARDLRQRVDALREAAMQCSEIRRLCRKGRLSEQEADRQYCQIRHQMQQQGFWPGQNA